MKLILESIQNNLNTISELQYVDQDWGQLDVESSNSSLQYPLCLIDIGSFAYNDIGENKTASPQKRQIAAGTIVLRIANKKTTTGSGSSASEWVVWDILENIHKKLHGVVVDNTTTGALMRTGIQKIKREDTLKEYEVTYSIGLRSV